ncbi:hypothetical protein CCAX7_34130 [Capsulimonas corticalis]|uniref:NADH-quinone oxidoreductase subunit H n=1 Tax=Capsulimonas corticalis TaxID=2219043 RepID=A0A402CYF4_9BACT|nr:NADH-quinone oxidoreductase subunit NuoH [Capsulimonas corticalis]BDI31362.1 hypothetical protein CCAX7_34130 [Capsulimonas corticalis]
MTPNLFFHYFFNVDPAHTGTGNMPAEYWWIDLIRIVVRVLVGLFAILLVVPPLVWWERRLLGFMQQRQGPNRVGPFGLLQTIADGVKLLLKEDMNPTNVDVVLFVLAPIVFLIPALVTSAVVPWGPSLTWGASAPNVSVGVLYLLAWGSLAVYGVVLAGWASNNKYSLLGGLRSSAQMISYELGMGLAIVTVVLLTGSLSMHDVVMQQGFSSLGLPEWNLLKFFPMGFVAMLIYAISMLAETNRAPFDLPEAETELVAGYHTEYTSMKFAIFFMAEYANMIVVSAICATLFFGGFHAPLLWLDGSFLGPLVGKSSPLLGGIVAALVPVIWLVAKILCGLYFFIWVRATMPRLRYDMLMRAGWLGVLPIALGNILMVAIAMALGYPAGLIAWLVVFGIAFVVFAGSKAANSFTTNSRRDTTVRLYGEAQPYRTVPEHSGHGAQTLPPNALSEAALAAAAQAPLDDAFAAKKG